MGIFCELRKTPVFICKNSTFSSPMDHFCSRGHGRVQGPALKFPVYEDQMGRFFLKKFRIDLQIRNLFLGSEIMALRKSGLVFGFFFLPNPHRPLYNYFGYGPKWSDKGLVDHFDPNRLTLNRKGSQIERGSFFFGT